MGNHAIHVHVTGGTDAIKQKAREFVAEMKKLGTVSAATITHGATEMLEGVGEAIAENRQ